MIEEAKKHLTETIIPFWENLRDDKYGGYRGYMNFNLKIDDKAVKGCILNSRILWFFSQAYMILKDDTLLSEARHAYSFLTDNFMDKEYGGVYWSVNFDGTPADTAKHTYCQAFAVYGLSAYYMACRDKKALDEAIGLFNIIESKCTDSAGYLESLDREFNQTENDKLSENGVMASKTMNTLLHVFEAYAELYLACENENVKRRLRNIMDIFAKKVYNPKLQRQEVFFDENYNSILDMQSYGHDIETSWLIDRGTEILGEQAYKEKMAPITAGLAQKVYKAAYDGRSIDNECVRGVTNTMRVWWVQAEAVNGFLNAYQKDTSKTEYLIAAENVFDFINKYIVDKRQGSEWFWQVDKDGRPDTMKPIVEPWKCPYHNGRMCMEIIRRNIE